MIQVLHLPYSEPLSVNRAIVKQFIMSMERNTIFLPRRELHRLLHELSAQDYTCYGPTVKDGTIAYLPIEDVAALPSGYRDEQSPAHYRLSNQGDERQFAWANGPQALKPLLFKPMQTLWSAHKSDDGLELRESEPVSERLAIIGARACDIAALYLQDRHFLHTATPDPYYRAAREHLFIVAVNCSHPAATCFCASTGDGPSVSYGYDLALTELDEGFIVEAYSAQGQELLQTLPRQDVTPEQRQQAEDQHQAAIDCQSRALPSRKLQQELFSKLDHPQWDNVAQRCLSCGNCTAVCPSCFCHSEHDAGGLELGQSEHLREWDSCFTAGHSYIHGITIRAGTRERYRQWLTHKLGSWHEQYGRSGCVGCGRCISWCPAGIDLTAEVSAICTGDGDD